MAISTSNANERPPQVREHLRRAKATNLIRQVGTMGNEHSGASPQIIYGRREDALEVWRQRDPARPHRRYDEAYKTVVECDKWLAEWFVEDMKLRDFEFAEYRERRVWGE